MGTVQNDQRVRMEFTLFAHNGTLYRVLVTGAADKLAENGSTFLSFSNAFSRLSPKGADEQLQNGKDGAGPVPAAPVARGSEASQAQHSPKGTPDGQKRLNELNPRSGQTT